MTDNGSMGPTHLCDDADCPYSGKPSPSACACHKTEAEMLRLRVVELEADNTYLAKTLLDMGEKVVLYVDEFEDEGDRVYLGSTNHADYFRELRRTMDSLWFERETAEKAASGRDLYAELRAVRERNRDLAEALTEARAALHQHYVDWDGEPEDAVPLQLARAKCDAALQKAGLSAGEGC